MTSSATSSSALSGSCNAALTGGRKQSRSVDKKRKAGRTLVLVVVMFAALWLPVHIHLLVMYFGQIPETRFYEVNHSAHATCAFYALCIETCLKSDINKHYQLSVNVLHAYTVGHANLQSAAKNVTRQKCNFSQTPSRFFMLF